MAKSTVTVGRVYDEPADDGGVRVLVDRIWPRGLSKRSALLDDWVRTVAPSTELRRWYGHDPDRFTEFRSRYLRELAEPERRDAVDKLRDRATREPLILLTATRDVAHSHAVVLAELLGKRT